MGLNKLNNMKTNSLKENISRNKLSMIAGAEIFSYLTVWIFTSLLIDLFYSQSMPTAFFLNQLDKNALNNHEDILLIKYYIFGIITMIFIIIHFALLGITVYNFNKLNKWMIANGQIAQSKKQAFSFYTIICLYSIFPFVFIFYFVKKKYLDNYSQIKKDKIVINQNKNSKITTIFTTIFLIVLTNFFFVIVPTMTSILAITAPYYSKVNSQLFYQNALSKNHENVLYLYFDRADGWRVKKTIEENKGLRLTYKDFTFFENNISFSDTTNASLPSMNFGYNVNVLDKKNVITPIKSLKISKLNNPQEKVNFPGSESQSVSDLSIRDYYKYSFANFVAFWNYLGYETINICEYPYFGYQSPLIFRSNNASWMNDDMRREFGFKNFTAVTANELQWYNGRKIWNNNVDDAEIVNNFIKDTKFNNPNTNVGITTNNVLTAIYSQQTHWDVAAHWGDEKYHVIVGNNNKNVMLAIKNALTDVANIITKLKAVKYRGQDSDGNETVYDHTTIVILSDHGHCFDDEETPNSLQKAAGFDPVFMIKPRKVVQSNINYSQLLTTTADALSIIRQYLYPNWKSNNKELDPWNPKNRYDLQTYEKFSCFKQYLDYPSKISDDTQLMSDSWKRKFQVMRPSDWRYIYWRKEILPSWVRKFSAQNYKVAEFRTIFNKQNWVTEYTNYQYQNSNWTK